MGHMPYNGISVLDMYRTPLDQLPIPKDHRVVDFRPPQPKDLLFSVISWTVLRATAKFHELCPRLILVEVEPCELCGEYEPVTMTEIKKTGRSKTYSIMMLCAGCIDENKNLIKLT